MAEAVVGVVVEDFRCHRCNKLHAERAGPGTRIRCMRCGAITSVPGELAGGDVAETAPAGKSPGRSRAKTTQ